MSLPCRPLPGSVHSHWAPTAEFQVFPRGVAGAQAHSVAGAATVQACRAHRASRRRVAGGGSPPPLSSTGRRECRARRRRRPVRQSPRTSFIGSGRTRPSRRRATPFVLRLGVNAPGGERHAALLAVVPRRRRVGQGQSRGRRRHGVEEEGLRAPAGLSLASAAPARGGSAATAHLPARAAAGLGPRPRWTATPCQSGVELGDDLRRHGPVPSQAPARATAATR